jgi:hypothetical protein
MLDRAGRLLRECAQQGVAARSREGEGLAAAESKDTEKVLDTRFTASVLVGEGKTELVNNARRRATH